MTGWKQNNPGCECCCPECVIVDHFSESAHLDEYTQESGAWTLEESHNFADDGRYAAQTEDSDARLIHAAGHPQDKRRFFVGAGAALPDPRDYLTNDYQYKVDYLLIFAWADEDNHCYIKFWFRRGATVQSDPDYQKLDWFYELHVVESGTDTLKYTNNSLVPTANIFPLWTIHIYYDNGVITDNGWPTEFEIAVGDPDNFGDRFGVGTGTIDDPAQEPAQISLLQATKVEQYCANPGGCWYCEAYTEPSQIEVEFSGVADDMYTGSESLNAATLYLDRHTTSPCLYWIIYDTGHTDPSFPYNPVLLYIEFSILTGRFKVVWNPSTLAAITDIVLDPECERIDCLAYDHTADLIPQETPNVYDFSSATVHVRSIA